MCKVLCDAYIYENSIAFQLMLSLLPVSQLIIYRDASFQTFSLFQTQLRGLRMVQVIGMPKMEQEMRRPSEGKKKPSEIIRWKDSGCWKLSLAFQDFNNETTSLYAQIKKIRPALEWESRCKVNAVKP